MFKSEYVKRVYAQVEARDSGEPAGARSSGFMYDIIEFQKRKTAEILPF